RPGPRAAADAGRTPPPRSDDLPALEALRADLHEAGYDLAGVRRSLGDRAADALHREQPLLALRATAGLEDPAGVLVRCFVLGHPVPPAVLDRCLPRTRTSGLVRLGLVMEDGTGVRATCDLRPYGTEHEAWWVASDP